MNIDEIRRMIDALNRGQAGAGKVRIVQLEPNHFSFASANARDRGATVMAEPAEPVKSAEDAVDPEYY